MVTYLGGVGFAFRRLVPESYFYHLEGALGIYAHSFTLRD